MKSFHERLHDLRRRAGLTKGELARRSGCSPSSISRFEHVDPSKRRLPSTAILAGLARGLGVPLEVLLTPDFTAHKAGQALLACRAKHKGWNPAEVGDTSVLIGQPQVGAGSKIGHFVLIDASCGEVVFGQRCEISNGAHVLTRAVDKNGRSLTGSVKCGSNVVIGSHAILLPGTELGDGVVVLPGSTQGLGGLLLPSTGPPAPAEPAISPAEVVDDEGSAGPSGAHPGAADVLDGPLGPPAATPGASDDQTPR